MATVYRGTTPDRKGEDVAIKIMNPDLAKESRFVRRFRREAKAAAMLKHPNTVQILEFGVDQNYVFLAMELLQGFDLAMLLHRERRVTDVRAAQIVIQVCRALSAAHEQSIIHRDLKPDNIMLVKQPAGEAAPLPGLAPTDFVKVLDFGIAKILDDDGKDGPIDPRADPVTQEKSMLTRVGTIVGTPAYMAPEQGRAEPVDARTDIYACGVLMYELVTGRVPFTGETPMQVVMRHVNEAPRPPSEHARVHPELEKLIMRALAKFPAQRQQSAEELAFELLRVLPIVAPPPAAAPPVEDNKRTLVIESTAATTAPSPGAPPPNNGARPAPAPRPAAGAPARPAPVPEPANPFPTLNIEVPDDIFPVTTPIQAPAPTQRIDPPKASAARPLPAAGRPAAQAKPAASPAAPRDLTSTLQSSVEEPAPVSEDDEEAATMVKAPTDVDRARLSLAEEAMAKALAQPIPPIGVGLPSFTGPESVEPTLIAAGGNAPSPVEPNPHERTVVSAPALAPEAPVPVRAAPPVRPVAPAPVAAPAPPKAPLKPDTTVVSAGTSSGSIDLKNLASTVPIEPEEVDKALRDATQRAESMPKPPGPPQASSPAVPPRGHGASPAPPPGDGPVRKPTSELIPVQLDDKPAPLGAAPSPAPAEAPLVWTGKAKTSRLSGPTALIVGIAIGAILVAAALGAVLLLRGS